MYVDIVWECKMIAVIMVIILAVKGSLGCCVFALLPCLGSGLHNPHPSHSQGSKIHFMSWECNRCPNTPKTNVSFVLGLPVLWFLNMMNFMVLKQAFHCLQSKQVWEKLQMVFYTRMLWWTMGSKALGYSPSCFTLSACRGLVLYNYWAIIAQLKHQQRCVMRCLSG